MKKKKYQKVRRSYLFDKCCLNFVQDSKNFERIPRRRERKLGEEKECDRVREQS